MIQPSPSLAVAGSVLSVEAPVAPGIAGQETSGFAAMLAISTASAVEPAGSASPGAVVPDSIALRAAGPAMPGKTLPPVLPVGEPIAPAPPTLAGADVATPTDEGQHRSTSSKTGHGKDVRRIVTTPEETSTERKPASSAMPETPANPVQAAALILLPPVEPIARASGDFAIAADLSGAAPAFIPDQAVGEALPLAVALVEYHKAQVPVSRITPTNPVQAGERSESQALLHEVQQTKPPVAPVLPLAPIPRAIGSLQTTPSVSLAAETLSISPETILPEVLLPARPPRILSPTPAPAELVQIELALPRLNMPTDVARPELNLTAKLAEPAMSVAAPQQSALATQPQIGLTVPAIPQVRPHDFAALIDRLTVAREAAVPQAVSITVTHQDFGPVRLNFGPQDAGLTVAMTSADPEFARAAAAAPALVAPVIQGEQASFTQSRSDNAPGQSSQSGSFAQPRGQASERRESQSQPHANPSPRTGQNRSTPRQGIFA